MPVKSVKKSRILQKWRRRYCIHTVYSCGVAHGLPLCRFLADQWLTVVTSRLSWPHDSAPMFMFELVYIQCTLIPLYAHYALTPEL